MAAAAQSLAAMSVMEDHLHEATVLLELRESELVTAQVCIAEGAAETQVGKGTAA